MKQLMMRTTSPDLRPQQLRQALQEDRSAEIRYRRAVVAVSLVGIASMAVVTLLQTGMARHLPDPPVGNFHSDKVNSSDTAYGYGMPDGPLTIAAHAANVALASAGPPDRWRRRPAIPLLASIVAGGQAAVAAKYLFYQMPKVDRTWCPYCIVDALTHFATFALTLPEALKGLSVARH